jgi:hypothetical protein
MYVPVLELQEELRLGLYDPTYVRLYISVNNFILFMTYATRFDFSSF